MPIVYHAWGNKIDVGHCQLCRENNYMLIVFIRLGEKKHIGKIRLMSVIVNSVRIIILISIVVNVIDVVKLKLILIIVSHVRLI